MITDQMLGSDVTFEQTYEYAMIDQYTGEIVRGPVADRDELFDGLTRTDWRNKGFSAWFYTSDVEDQKYPMICRRRPVHVYRGDWS